MNVKNVWLDNKQFLIAVGGGLALFLFLGSFASGFVENADKLRKKSRQNRRDIISAHKDLKNSYFLEQAKVQDYEKQEATLKTALCMPSVTEMEGAGENQLRVRFDQSISDLWQEVQQKANRAGIRLPPRISSQDDFGVDSEDGVAQYRVYYSYLRIVRMALEALVDGGVTEISRPEVLTPENLLVSENDGETVCVYHGVAIGATGTYDSFLKVLENLQSDGKFLQARLRNLKSTRARSTAATGGAERLLSGEIEFIGFSLAERTEDMTENRSSKRRGRRRTRGR